MASATTELRIEGMTCNHCKRAVEQALLRLPGVASVEVDLQRGKATVHGSATHDAMVGAVTEEGYTARVVAPPPET